MPDAYDQRLRGCFLLVGRYVTNSTYSVNQKMDIVPALIASSQVGVQFYSDVSTQVCIGDTSLVLKLPTESGRSNNLFQCVIASLKDLTIHENVTWLFHDRPPGAISQYVGQSDFLLLLATNSTQRNHVPAGAFLELLEKVGAGQRLQRLVDIVSHLDDRPMPPSKEATQSRGYSYVLATTMGVGDDRGLEAMSLTNSQVLDFQLQWNEVLKRYMAVGFDRLRAE